MAQKPTTSGNIARLKDNFMRSFHSFEAESISEALRRIMRHMTEATLISANPIVLNMDTVEDIADDMDEDIVDDIMDEINSFGPPFILPDYLLSPSCSTGYILSSIIMYKYFSYPLGLKGFGRYSHEPFEGDFGSLDYRGLHNGDSGRRR
ncbi:hypothetical protein [Candidatus Methanocrinis natronophilus]|uniref:Uncharacterized protein n=1 Tax=Candidatus Methanocrinis natronophilus TaxID=3033396 RepID=A0ABT5X952_9EURY|nr:hypothetical protein [Candidatus Methanocrinis natronophilus]MDF0591216.1 hypothetical protein [Candidatus Methanocrinis natronophilus]